MQLLERYNDPEQSLREAIMGIVSGLWQAMPAIIDDFNPTTQTVTATPSIKGRVRGPDGKISLVQLPQCLDVPVYYFRAGGFAVTAPPEKGDECLLVFTDRCIDSWWQNGGIQAPMDMRMKDLSDAMAFVGFTSVPRALSNVSTNSLQVRTEDGTTYFEVQKGGICKIKAPTQLVVDTPVMTVTGVIDVQNQGNLSQSATFAGTIKALVDVIAGTVSLKSHTHKGVQPGSGNTGVPN